MGKLTDRQIRSIKPTDKDQFYADGEGLYLRVTKKGHKTFYRKDQTNGKTKWIHFGSYPDTSLLEARTKLTEPKELQTLQSVQSVYTLFVKNVLNKYKRPELSISRFNLDVLPAFGTRDIKTITRRDIADAVQKIIDRGSPVAANRTLADLNHFFQFAWERGYVETNPCSGFSRKSAGGREKPRERTLDWDEIESLFSIEYDSTVTRAALYLCLLTGQRASEVLWIMSQPPARWVELPTTKSDRPHKVYLSIQARAALKLLKGLPPPKDHRVLSHALRRVGASFTPHDLRRTMATRLADLGVAPHVTEKMLNHKMEGVMAVYNHAEYLPERMAAWRLWGTTIAQKRRASKS